MVIIILAVCITRFYFDVSKNTEKSTSQTSVYIKNEQPVDGFYIFKNENNLFGAADQNNNILIEPQWESIEIQNDGLFIVSDDFKGNRLYGCVDSEGNAKVPFIFSGFEKFGNENMFFYVGKISGEDSCIVYDNKFNPCLGRVWDRFSISGNNIKLYFGEDLYSYFADSDGISLKSVTVKNKAMKKKYSININSRVLLSKLDFKSIEKISDCISAYIEYSFKGDFSCVEKYAPSGGFLECREFFSEYSDIIVSKKLRAIKDVSIYQQKLEDGSQCINASVKISADVFYMQDGELLKITDNYCANVKFSERDFGTVNMISASFVDDEIIPQETEVPVES